MADNFSIPGFNPLRFTPQMPYAQFPGLADTKGTYNTPTPNSINPNQNSGSQYQTKSQWQFGINYNHLAFSNAVQGVGAFLRSNNQRNDFKQYNRDQQNPLSQIPENPNNTQQALYGDKQYRKGGKVKYEGGGPGPGKPAETQGPINFLNSYYNSATFKNRMDTFSPGQYKDQIDYIHQGTDHYKPFVIQNGLPTVGSAAMHYPDLIGENKKIQQSFRFAHEENGPDEDVSTILSQPQAKRIGANLYREVIPHEYTHNTRGLTEKEEQEIMWRSKDPNSLTYYNQSKGLADQVYNWQHRGKDPNTPRYDVSSGVFEQTAHDMSPNEKYADLNALRFQMYQQGIYDTRKGDMKLEDIQKAMKDPGIKDSFIMKRMLQNFKPEDIVKFNNTIASTNNNQEIPESKKGGQVKFAQGGQFDNYDDFDEEDFQDLKDELDNYFKDRGNKPIENLTEDKEDDQTQQDQPEQEDNYRPTGAMDFLNQQQPDYEQQDKSDKDIMDQLSGQQPIPEPQQTEQPQDDHPSIEAFKNGISRVENAGYNEGNKNSTAFGKYQFTAPTREGVRQQFFSTISKKDFEDAYKSDPKFQEKVMDVYGNHLLNIYGGDPHKAAMAFFLGPGKANMYNQPNYNPGHGNVSVGQYLNTFDKGYSKKKGGYIMEDGGQGPGDGKKPTAADSLALYNNASQVKNYYLNNPDYHQVGTPIKYPSSKMFNENDAGVQLMKNNNYSTIQPGHNTSTKITPDQYRKNVDNNRYYQRELQNTMLDLNSPMSLFDKRISPQFQTDYSNVNTGDVVTLNQYDPIAVKPWNMLTDPERKERIQKYGDPTKGTSNPSFIPSPMNKSKVQSVGSLRSPYGPVQGSPMIPGQLAGQGQTPYSFTGRDDNGQQTTKYFNDLDTWKNATNQMGYANRQISGDNKTANATGYQFKEGGEYSLTKLQAAQLKRFGYEIEEI